MVPAFFSIGVQHFEEIAEGPWAGIYLENSDKVSEDGSGC